MKKMADIKINIKGCKNIKCLRNFIKFNKIKLILFAETHGFLNEIPIQKKIINNVNPNFFLYEMLEEIKILNRKSAKTFLSKPNNEDFSVISTYGELKPIVRMATNFQLPIIGCDIKNMGFNSKNKLNKEFFRKYGKEIIKKRETRQSKIINDYTSKGLVFASIGAYHLRRNSITIKKLKEKKVIIIHPLFNGKEKFLIPQNQRKTRVSFNIKVTEKR